jgi:zinc transport system substrate-binding protein
MRIILAFLVAGLLLAGCGGGGSDQVVAAFYPLAWAAQTIGGPALHVRNVTPSGAEPHDIELTPRIVADIQEAKLVLYLSHGFQPAMEEAVRDAKGTRLDALQGIGLRAGVGDEAGKTDPHVWLDPVLFAGIVRRIGRALGRPRAGDALAAKVAALDREYRAGLRDCTARTFVTSHAAFGYLASRYGLHQVAITGLDPQAEPSAQRLASLAKLVRRLGTGTVFFERLVSPKLAETVAREAGAKTAVLDPIEGLTPSEAAQGTTYLSLMRQNLRALRLALRCR